MSLERGTGIDGERNGDGARDHAARAATLRVIERHGAQVMRTARRYALTPEDAEDAYQRAVEIMLTKAPAIPDADLLPWLKTVVKHEAFALRRQEERSARAADGSLDGASETEAAIASPVPSPIEQSERFERLRLGAEAMRHLKPQEIRALTLLAQGYTYRQICDETGWTYTKVNRCLAEGRQSFLQRVAGIESGDECRRLEPKLSALADGEAAEEDLAGLRRHLRRCLACRATFREQYLAPGIVGALAPSALLDAGATLFERLHELVATLKVKAASVARLPGVDGGAGAGHPGLSSGSGRLVSAGLAKGLAVLAVGGAGVGGAIAGAERLLDSKTPESADAATRTDTPPQLRGDPGGPDPLLAAERLRPTDAGDDAVLESGGSGSRKTSQGRSADSLEDRPIGDCDTCARSDVRPAQDSTESDRGSTSRRSRAPRPRMRSDAGSDPCEPAGAPLADPGGSDAEDEQDPRLVTGATSTGSSAADPGHPGAIDAAFEGGVTEERRHQTYERRHQTYEPRHQTHEPRHQTHEPRHQTHEPDHRTQCG